MAIPTDIILTTIVERLAAELSMDTTRIATRLNKTAAPSRHQRRKKLSSSSARDDVGGNRVGVTSAVEAPARGVM
jgi:hypothetical protein